MEMRIENFFVSRVVSLLRELTVLVVCCTVATAQAQRSAPPSNQRQTAPPLPDATPSGGMLQPRQSNPGLRPTLLGNDIEQMTQAQFRALADTTIVHYKGQSLSKAAFTQQRLKEMQMQLAPIQANAQSDPGTLKTQFQLKQAADLASRNARVQTLINAMNQRMGQLASSPSYSALVNEAQGLQNRYSTASPAEQVRMKQRAVEVNNQLLKMEAAADSGH